MSCAVPSLLERKSGDRRGAELWSAARDGDENKIRSLLSAKPKLVNARDCGGNTALIWASLKGHEGCVQALLDLGADVEVTSDMRAEGETALICASRKGHAAVALLLRESSAKVDVADREGTTPLQYAKEINSTETLEVLRRDQRAIDTQMKKDRTLFKTVAREVGKLEKVRWLLSKDVGARPDRVRDAITGRTALLEASAQGHAAQVQALVAAGANTEARSDGAKTVSALLIH